MDSSSKIAAPTESGAEGKGSSELKTAKKVTRKTLQVVTSTAVQRTVGKTCQEEGKNLQ